MSNKAFKNTTYTGFESKCKCANGYVFDVLNNDREKRIKWAYNQNHQDYSCIYPWKRSTVVLSGGNVHYPSEVKILGKETNFTCTRDICNPSRVGARLYKAPIYALPVQCKKHCKGGKHHGDHHHGGCSHC